MEGLALGPLPLGLCREAEGGTMGIGSLRWHRAPRGQKGLEAGLTLALRGQVSLH